MKKRFIRKPFGKFLFYFISNFILLNIISVLLGKMSYVGLNQALSFFRYLIGNLGIYLLGLEQTLLTLIVTPKNLVAFALLFLGFNWFLNKIIYPIFAVPLNKK